MSGHLPSHLLVIALGGAAGASARALVAAAGHALAPEHPHRATLLVNASGSFALGCLAAWVALRPASLSAPVQSALAVGLLGAFTTYSTFAVDALDLVRAGRIWSAAGYALLTTAVAIGLAAAGSALVTELLGGSSSG